MGRRIAESPLAPLIRRSTSTDLGIAGRAFRVADGVLTGTREVLLGSDGREQDCGVAVGGGTIRSDALAEVA